MHPTLIEHREEITALCERHGLKLLELVGSACRGDFVPGQSDLDFIATFVDTGPGYSDRYIEFADSLETLLGISVDVITPGSIKSPEFLAALNACRQVIYGRPSQDQAA